MLNTLTVAVRFSTFVKAVSSSNTPLPGWNTTSAPKYDQLVVTPVSQAVPLVPVHVYDATFCTSRPTILLAVSFVRTAVTPAGNDDRLNAPKPEPPIEPL